MSEPCADRVQLRDATVSEQPATQWEGTRASAATSCCESGGGCLVYIGVSQPGGQINYKDFINNVFLLCCSSHRQLYIRPNQMNYRREDELGHMSSPQSCPHLVGDHHFELIFYLKCLQ